MHEHSLNQSHYVTVIAIGLIALQQGEFRVMFNRNAFITKDTPYLVDSVEAAYHQSLEVELQSNSQIEVFIKGVVMGDKGARQCSTGMGLKHRSLYLHKTLLIEKASYGSDDLATQNKNVSALFVGNEVEISLPVAFFHVSQPVPLLGQRAKGFTEYGEIGYLQSEFPGFCSEELPACPDNVADVDILQQFVPLAAQ
jgi:hypothetical protein